MDIQVDIFKCTFSENELYEIVFCIVHDLESQIEHSANFEGMETLKKNNQTKIHMLETMCQRLGRVYIFSDTMKGIEKKIEAIKTSKKK